jgi:putative transport protein
MRPAPELLRSLSNPRLSSGFASNDFIPLMIVGLVARRFFKLDYPTICGVLAGSMTDPPALPFATGITKSDQPLVTYAAVYPLVMILRVFIVQVLVLMLGE